MLEKQAKNVILAIGSNLGNKRHNILKAKFLINTDKKLKLYPHPAFIKPSHGQIKMIHII